MRAIEIINEQDLEEKWKGLAAAGLLGAGVAATMLPRFISPPATHTTTVQEPSTPQAPSDRFAVLEPHEPLDQQSATPQGVRPATEHPNEIALFIAAIKAGIQGVELAQLMAQARHETQNFTKLVEKGTTSDFNMYDIRYSPERAKILGNDKPGDGARYRGRGYLHITGKYNYRMVGRAIGIDLVKNPQLLENPDIAAKASIWFWQHRVMRRGVDPTNTGAVTKLIHPGLRHLDRRVAYYNSYMRPVD